MSYTVRKTDARNASEVDWNKVDAATLVANNGEQPSYQTDFAICCNGEKLFFRFDCDDDVVRSTKIEFNAPLYDEEVVELFISSGGDIKEYLEAEVNALKGVFLADVYNDMNGNVELRYHNENCLNPEVVFNGTDWSVTAELPLRLFQGTMDSVWSFNAYRIKRDENNGMILMAYSPTMEDNFHKPEYFSELIFE